MAHCFVLQHRPETQSLDDLTQLVANRAGIDTEQARVAISTILRYLASRLPSPAMGQIRALLDDTLAARPQSALSDDAKVELSRFPHNEATPTARAARVHLNLEPW